MGKTKIRFLINSLGGGGAEKVLTDLANQLVRQSFDVEILAVTGGVNEKNLNSAVRKRIIIKSQGRMGVFLRKCVFRIPLRLFGLIFMREKFDIEAAYLEGNSTRFLGALKTSAARIAFVHSDLSVGNSIQPFYENADSCLKEYAGFDQVCFVSKRAQSGFEKVYGHLQNAMVLHNVMDFDEVHRKSLVPADVLYRTQGLKIVTVGRLTPIKGYDRLLKVYAELNAQYDMELWIVGDGKMEQQLKEQISENHISSVHLLGYQSNPYSLMKQADIYVCSSYYEGYSTAVLEAMTLGIPTLTTDCAGMEEILDGGKYGWIVENSEAGLRDGLLSLLRCPQKVSDMKNLLPQRAGEIIKENSIDNYVNLLNDLAERAKRKSK